MELYSPQIAVDTERYHFTKGLELELNSCEDTYYDWAKLQFVMPIEQKVTLARREKVLIRLGYNGALRTVFSGYTVNLFLSGANSNEIILKDAMLLLEEVMVNNTFVQATPQEIIRYCANLAGISRLQLDDTPYPPIPCLPIFSQNAARAIQSLGSYWGIFPKFYFQQDTLCWGAKPQQQQICSFVHGKNIIRLQLTGGLWALETVSVPFIRHGQSIRVAHPRIAGDFPVCRIRVTTKPQGFIRTTLYFIAV